MFFLKEKVLFTYFSTEIKQIFCESLSHRITCCNMSFLPSLWNVMFAGGIGPACLPVWLPACLVNKDLRPTLDEPFYTYFQHCLNVIAHITMTHQPFLLDSSWTFTCHPWRKKYKRPFKEHMCWNYLMELLDTHCNHLIFFYSTYLLVLARGPPSVCGGGHWNTPFLQQSPLHRTCKILVS